jgi:hypothetical protein
MSTTKKELQDKMELIRSHQAALLNLVYALETKPEIHFEIGRMKKDGTTERMYSSKSISDTLRDYALNGYSPATGYLIDVWENDAPVADISSNEKLALVGKSRLLFQINKKIAISTEGDMESPTIAYEYETVFRSSSVIDCRTEWIRKEYNKEEYVMDIREAPEGKETYHVADIDINSMVVEEAPKKYGKDWLVSLIKIHIRGCEGVALGVPEQLAERILQVYKGEQA